jgi:ribose-phosphate pyrophosphokinase
VLDVHNLSAFQNAFRIPTEHLESKHLFARHFAARFAGAPLAVVSPDAGGMKRARELREAIARTTGATVATGMTEKYRDASGISGELFAGDVAGRTVIIPDDLVASGSTLIRTARACREHGAQRVYAAATHAPFTAEASGNLGDPALDGLIITNTIPPSRLEPEVAARKLEVLDATPLFAEAIRRLNVGGSIADLLENPPE